MRTAAPLVLALLVAVTAWAQDEEDDGGFEVGTPGDAAPESTRLRPHPKRKPGEKHARVIHKSQSGSYRIQLPDDWAVEEGHGPDAVLAFDLHLPGSEERGRLFVARPEWMPDPRATPHAWREHYLNEVQALRSEVEALPLPHLVLHHRRDDRDQVTALAFLDLHGHGFIARMECSAADFADARADFLEAAASFEADVPDAFTLPAGYTVGTSGSWEIARHEDVAATALGALEKVLKAEERRFRRLHGALPRGARFRVVVHASKQAARGLSPQAAEWRFGYYMDPDRQCLFAVPLAKDEPKEAALCAGHAHALLYLHRYGQMAPRWTFIGEREAAWAEGVTGKAMPYLAAPLLRTWADRLSLEPLDKLEAMAESDWDSFYKQAFFYVGFFRAGPARYRKAYKDFLDDLGRTYDAAGAVQRHLEPLGYDAIRKEAQEFVARKIRPVDPD